MAAAEQHYCWYVNEQCSKKYSWVQKYLDSDNNFPNLKKMLKIWLRRSGYKLFL